MLASTSALMVVCASALGPADTTSNLYTREVRRRDREDARKYEETKPPLTEEEKAVFRAALEKMTQEPAPQ